MTPSPLCHDQEGDNSPEVTAVSRAVLGDWAGPVFAAFVLVLWSVVTA